jgi:hypothetical protein
MRFIVPPENGGQIVEVSFAEAPEGVWMRVEDRSDRSIYYKLARWTTRLRRWSDSVGPQNREPPTARWGRALSERDFLRITDSE